VLVSGNGLMRDDSDDKASYQRLMIGHFQKVEKNSPYNLGGISQTVTEMSLPFREQPGSSSSFFIAQRTNVDSNIALEESNMLMSFFLLCFSNVRLNVI